VNWYANSQTPPRPSAGAQFWIPTLDEWIKAGFYSPTKGGTGGYWLYATQSDSAPVKALATTDGACANPGPNVANYNYAADWAGQNGHVLTAGGTGSPSYYGTYDQSGSLLEWNDEASATNTNVRGQLGGSYVDYDYALQYTHTGAPFADAQYNGAVSGKGFRVAGVVVPKIPFAAWQQRAFSAAELADAAVSGASADPDGDGVPNLVEFATGSDTRTARPALEVTGDATAHDLSRATTSATLVLESSTDLVQWTAAADGVDGVRRESVRQSAETDRVTWTFPPAERRFFRLRATVP
jgi:hypothetical protein